jgi:hypothetical protein
MHVPGSRRKRVPELGVRQSMVSLSPSRAVAQLVAIEGYADAGPSADLVASSALHLTALPAAAEPRWKL